MTYRLPPLQALRAFESASRHLSFKKAAEELHVTPAAISQQVKALEGYLGVPLFRRLTRAIELTGHGAAMLPKVREGFECLAAAVESTRQEIGGVLTVTAPPSFASRWLLPRLSRFSAIHPEIELRLASSPDTIDRRGDTAVLEEGVVDPRSDSSRLAIRYGTGKYPGYRVERVFSPAYVPVCRPSLLTGEHPLHEPADLRWQVLIHDETIAEEDSPPGWPDWLRLAGAGQVDARRGPRFSNAVLAIGAALDGQGVALAPRPLIEADVAAGRLAIPFDICVPSPYAYFLVMQEAVARRAAVAAFRSWLMAEAVREDEKLL